MFARSRRPQPGEDLVDIEAKLDRPEIPAFGKETTLKCHIRVQLLADQRVSGSEPMVTNARLMLTFPESVTAGLAFKTRPERLLLGTLASGQKAELKIGAIDGDQLHTFLIQIRVPSRGAGELEIARAELRYDAPSRDLLDQRREVRVSVTYAGGVESSEDSHGVQQPRATRAQLAERFLEAHRLGYRAQSIEHLQQLIEQSDDEAERKRLDTALLELTATGKLDKEMLETCFQVSTEEAGDDGAALFDVVLVDAGERPIRVVREIRAATGLALRDVSGLVKEKEVAIGHALRIAQAGALRRRIQAVGGRVEIRRREGKESQAAGARAEDSGRRTKMRRRRR